MQRVLKLALATAAMGFAASPAFAQTATVNGTSLAVNQDTTIHFNGPAGTTAAADLYLKLTGASGGVFSFNYTLTNATPLVSNLTGFGFTTAPTLLAISGTGLNFVLNPVNYPGGYDVDACGTSGNTGGGGDHCDAANGQGDLFGGTFALTFASGTTDITLGGFVDRYASLCELAAPGSNECPSGEGTPGTPGTHGAVPEPATWAMMLLGFGGIGMAMRRRRKDSRLLQVA